MVAENSKYVSIGKFAIAISQSVIYLLFVIILCFLATLLDIKGPPEETFESKYEKYVLDAIGVYMIIPFVLSLFLILAILQKNVYFVKMWFNISLGVLSLIILVILGSGIFIIIKGTLYVGCSLIAIDVLLSGLGAYYFYVSLAIVEEIEGIKSKQINEDYNNRNSKNIRQSSIDC